MKKNVGRQIQIISVVLAALGAAAFLALGAFYIISALSADDPALLTTGVIGLALCLVGAVLAPLCTRVLYGFGTMLINQEEQLALQRETKELLRASLADGALSEEISRKIAQAVAKANAATATARPVAQPVARPVAQPVAQPAPAPVEAVAPKAVPVVTVESAAPVAPAPVLPKAPAAPAETASAPIKAPVAPVTAPAPVKTTPVQPLTPLNGNNQTF